MLLVAARCRVHLDYCQNFANQVDRIIPLVRAEPGCIRYELHANVFESGLFIFCEEWASQKHLDDHIATPHMQEHFAKCAEWLAAPTELTLYEVSTIQSQVLKKKKKSGDLISTFLSAFTVPKVFSIALSGKDFIES